jgi:DNA-binding MltR family transcriptional regulator
MSEPAKKPTVDPKTQNVTQALANLGVSVDQIGLKTKALLLKRHAGIALVVAATLDRTLEGALRMKMNTLNNELAGRLFGDTRPLGNFSAKIDLAFAIGLVDSDNYKRLTKIRRIRNVFAHADDFVDFHTPAIQKLLLNLTDEASVKSSPETAFISIAKEIELAVTHATGRTAKDLQGLAAKKLTDQTSPKT